MVYTELMVAQFFRNLFADLSQNSGATLLFVAVVFAIAALFFILGRFFARIELRAQIEKRVSTERADAIKRSRAVLGGLAGEQLAPFLPGFPCNPADARFVGKPVDFVAFAGMSLGQAIQEVLLIEVKTGGAELSKREREIRDCVENGRVRFVVYNVPER